LVPPELVLVARGEVIEAVVADALDCADKCRLAGDGFPAAAVPRLALKGRIAHTAQGSILLLLLIIVSFEPALVPADADASTHFQSFPT